MLNFFLQIKRVLIIILYSFALLYVCLPVGSWQQPVGSWQLAVGKKIPNPKSKIQNPKLNVLLFTVDSLRPDHLGCYGYKKDISPAIDNLARNGVVFNKAIAQSAWTTPGMISIFTALYPHSHKVDARGKSLDESVAALPEILKSMGYATPAFSYLIRDPNYFNLGFEPAPEHIYDGGSIDDLLELINICKDKRFFIWYHNKYIHLPYKTPPPYDQLLPLSQKYGPSNISSGLSAVKNNVIVRSGTVEFEDGDGKIISELYDANVKRLDDDISLLVKRLKELKLSDRTLLIITADHGEELLDHGFVGHASTSLNAKLYDEIIHIPLIFFLPDHLSPKTICMQVQQIDIFPTILDILDINIPDALQGHSMLDLMKYENPCDGKPMWPEFALSETNKGGYQSDEEMKGIILTSLRTPGWKLICKDNKGAREYELYYLIDDSGENDNIYKDHPDVLTRLKSLMEQIKSVP